jgi:DNA polymerase III subunit epsilon
VTSTCQYAFEGLEVRPSGGLVDRALEALRNRPRHTHELARVVMGIQGAPPAAATAIFTLLGSDPRFAVDRHGVWTLVEPEAPGGGAPPLLREEWVVVDVETTGGSPRQGHRVTEVAAVCVSGGKICRTFSTLVNPDRRIPSMVTALTGITDEMVREAPRFHEVAADLTRVLRGRVFVAHNAAFDWGFLCSEIERAVGGRLDGRRLCTVRLARKLLPQLPSRSLDSLATYFGLEIEARHRALDDAVATAHVLLRLIDRLQEMEVRDWTEVQRFLARRGRRRARRASPRSMDSA